jgi:hypothetical protein
MSTWYYKQRIIMSFETQDSRPNRALNEEELTAEVGFSVPETLPPAENPELSLVQQLKRDGKALIEIIKKTSPEDMIRGINQL